MKRRLLLLVLPLLSSVLAAACAQLITPGPSPVPGSNPDIDATVKAAVAATVSAQSGAPIPAALATPPSPTPQGSNSGSSSSGSSDSPQVQATVTALLATPPVPSLSTSTATPVPLNPTPLPTLTPLPTQPLPASLPLPTATPEVITPPAATATVQPTPTVAVQQGCQLAQDGTLVTAWIDRVQVASSPVANRTYALFVEQPDGGSFAGKTVAFKIGDFDTNEAAIWSQGGGDELNLTADASVPPSAAPSAQPGTHHHLGGPLAQPLPPHVFLGTASLCGSS